MYIYKEALTYSNKEINRIKHNIFALTVYKLLTEGI